MKYLVSPQSRSWIRKLFGVTVSSIVIYKVIRSYLKWEPYDIVKTGDEVYIAGYSNPEGPPSTYGLRKKLWEPDWRPTPLYGLPEKL